MYLESLLQESPTPGWFLVQTGKKPRFKHCDVGWFATQSEAQSKATQLEKERNRRYTIIKCTVTMNPPNEKKDKIRWGFQPDTPSLHGAFQQFKEYWKDDTLKLVKSILWYTGEFYSLTQAGIASMRDELDKHSQNDRMLLVRNEDGIEPHPTIMVDRIFLESRRSVQAYLFLLAVEIAMKTLLVANRQEFSHVHNLKETWSEIGKQQQQDIIHIFSNHYQHQDPTSKPFVDLVEEYSKGNKGDGLYGNIRYIGEKAKGPQLPSLRTPKHLWKMVSCMSNYHFEHILSHALAVKGILTDFDQTQ